MRNPKEVEKEEYNEFYKKTFSEFLEPLAHTHFTTEVYWKFSVSEEGHFLYVVINLTRL